MRKYTGTGAQGPLVVVHAGARSFEGARDLLAARKAAVADAVGAVWPRLQGGLAAVDAVTALVERLEDAPSCNAGRGGALQSDGLARLSASVMDGARQRFSGVLLVTHLVHPSRLARALQEREETVLGPLGAQLLARELGIPPEAPALPETAEEWLEYLKDPATSGEHGGTVGAVVLDRHGAIAAATSTGGSSTNTPERVPDSATVAGNYASAFAGVSCTGTGEQIVDDGLAVRLEARVRDGRSFVEASEVALQEALASERDYGWIGLDRDGAWAMCCTSEDMPCLMMSADRDEPFGP